MLQRQCLRSLPNLFTPKQFLFVAHKKSPNFCHDSSKNLDASKELQDAPVEKLLDESATFTDLSDTSWATTPYPASAVPLMESDKPKRPEINPAETSVILFAGQGIIRVGDVKEYLRFPRAKQLFEIANDILGYDLLKMCLRGPQSMLNRTEFNQPATVVTSLAALEKLQEERPKAIETCVGVAGYSVGELTALIFAGAMPYEEGLKLVGVRATAMQAASEMSPQGMVSAFCSAAARPGKICEEAKKWALDVGAVDPVCRVAIYLGTQTRVFGGSVEALQYIEKNARDLGLRRVKRLPVSGAFHTELMEPALKPFIKALNKIQFEEPNAIVYSNYSADRYSGNEKLNRKKLIKQMISPVKWEQTMQNIYSRPEGTEFPRTFDVGSRGSMKAILNIINLKAANNCFIY